MNKLFNLPSTKCAQMVGVSQCTFMEYARKFPDELPHFADKSGKRPTYRFNKEDVLSFVRKRITSGAQNAWTEKLKHYLHSDARKVLARLKKNDESVKNWMAFKLDLMLNVFNVEIDNPADWNKLKDTLLEMKPFLVADAQEVIGDDAESFADYLINQALEYAMDWDLCYPGDEEAKEIYGAVVAYKVKTFPVLNIGDHC